MTINITTHTVTLCLARIFFYTAQTSSLLAMATPRKLASSSSSSVLAVATLVIVLSCLLSLATVSDACGCNSCPCTKPPESGGGGKCPMDALKLGVCADVLGGLVNLDLLGSRSGSSSEKQCCELVGGLADLEAAVCLCTALRADVLGLVDLDLPVQLSILVNRCGKNVPAGFQCPKNN
ncbi:hypothetical protein GUJ93_ZPchr0010g11176 [Zizania palustris]|uniref:Bifunctional inhibitor/plant lipid transfer protein/seed storage helical domain-containing protein n=1 Tax=Zizania palustris TaxID=103762 RepID=A0A8J5VVS0_ZIZPA|nr:hypothetical protein GUJ93_ZPchr0010g11176 [Zizania palustris]